MSSAAAVRAAIFSGPFTVSADLTNGETKGRWSISCSEPEPQRSSGARPPSTQTGEPLAWAPAIALIPLVTPGPAVSAATPIPRVALAKPSAANTADCSWRTSTISIPSALQPSYIENRCPPDSVKRWLTPRDFSALATIRPP